MSNPIRVLCLFTLLDRGGAETMCMNIYRNINRDKVQFDFLVYYPQKGQYEEEIERLGGRVFRIPHLDLFNLPAHISGAKKFFLTHSEICVVHNHMGENGAFICNEAKKAGIKTIIYHSHTDKGSVFNPHFLRSRNNKRKIINVKQFKLNCLYPIAIMNSTDLFACGKNAAQVFGKKAKKAIIIHNAIDLNKFRFDKSVREKKRIELKCESKYIIGNVARINDNKNQIFAINVMKEILKTFPDAEMWFIGDGPKRLELQEMVVRSGYDKNIKFLGVRSDVNSLLMAMDVFLFPSINEGLPVSCIEAQATGLPCVFSNGFDPETVITDNCTVISLDESTEHWAEAIMNCKYLVRKNMTEEVIMAGYDIKDSAKFLESFYLSRGKNR